MEKLVGGSVCDSVGRRTPFIWAAFFFFIFSLLIPHAESIYQLQILRLLQGIAVGFVNVPGRAIIADVYQGKEFYKMMNTMTIVWALGPIIAPVIGGYLQHYIGWQASFYFLAIYGFLIFVLCFLLPETIKEKRPFNLKKMSKQYYQILVHWHYFLGLICMGSLYLLLILFGLVAPFLIQNVLHYTPIQFGHMALYTSLSWFLGSTTNRFLIHIDISKKVYFNLFLMLLTTTVMLLFALKESISVYDIIIPTAILFYFGGMIFPNYFARNIEFFQHAAASANALMGAGIVLIVTLGSALGTLLKSHSQVPLTLAYMTIVLICLLSCFLNHRIPRLQDPVK